jgi:hypothetical protein
MTFQKFYIKENFMINLKSAIDQIEEIGYPRYIAEAVAKKAHEIFRLCGISENDFALQTVSDEVAVFGGWNRITARQDYNDDHLWTFYIDQGLSRPEIVKNFNKLSDAQKILQIKKESFGSSIVYHGTDVKSAKDIKQRGLDLSKCDKGYFGKAFYVTEDEALAKSNYADFSGDDEWGVVLKFEMVPVGKILDLRVSEDWNIYQNLKYKGRPAIDFIGFDEFAEIMKSLGIDAVYDRSNDAFAVYNLNVLKLK